MGSHLRQASEKGKACLPAGVDALASSASEIGAIRYRGEVRY